MPMSRLAAACVLVGLVAGCAAPARLEQMQVDTSLAQRTALASSPLKGGIAIREVTGGSETNPMWLSKVSSSEFERALEASLGAAGLLSPNRQASPYTLLADLKSLEQPYFGASLTVTATVTYFLVERASAKTVLERTIATPYTAAFGDAFIASERLRLANEGAIRANITRLIEELGALKVSAVELR
jgi:hypothetical protein